MKNKIRITKKKAFIIGFVCIILLLVAGAAVGNYFYNLALNPAVSKDMIFGEDEETEKQEVNWITEQSGYTDQFITSEDGLKLHAYEITNTKKSDVWVLVVHGYTGQGSDQYGYAKGFYDMGYNVLVPDLRGHGLSDGDYIGMGWDDRLDIMKWTDYIIAKDSEAQIVLHGVSMGGATVMMVAGEQLPSNVKCIIEDSGYTSVWSEFSYQLDALFNLPAFPVMQLANLATKVRAGYWISDASAIDQLARATRPMLFIHGDNDDFVPFFMLDQVYNAANVEKEKLVIEGAAHAKALETNPEIYWKTIDRFVTQYVKTP
ncbi:MAG: alpha/beta hydrolase [bacterium]|nr:alpha/beta hydrolase [bacterium]